MRPRTYRPWAACLLLLLGANQQVHARDRLTTHWGQDNKILKNNGNPLQNSLTSSSHKYMLCFDTIPGRKGLWLVVKRLIPSDKVIWAEHLGGEASEFRLEFQPNGNLAVYNMDGGGKHLVWHSNTPGGKDDRKSVSLVLQDDGNLCIYSVRDTRSIVELLTWQSGKDPEWR